jgi:Flp pilus assembly protein TadD
MLAGAAFGGGLVALVAILVFWAQRDATPDVTQPSPPGASAAAAGSMPDNGIDRGEPALPPAVAAQVAALEAEIESTGDLESRRSLAQLLLAHGQMFAAFQQSRALLEASPQDPTGHYVSGVVRYTMGQPDEALQHLDAALAAAPTFAQAALVKGILLLQMEDRAGAVAAWQQGWRS